jgi:hypothetical protein
MAAVLLAALPFAAPVLAQDALVRYAGHKVVRVDIRSDRDLRAMLRISADVWSEHIGIGPADFRVAPESLAALAASGLSYTVLVEDVQERIDAERARLAAPAAGAGWFDDFKDLAAVEARLDELAALRPDLAQVVQVGTSLEGRPIRGLRICNDGTYPGRRKPGMVWASTQHAREWIAPMVTMYLAETLLTRYGADPDVTRVVDRAETFIVPVVNVDGYVYSWTTDRLWRKNRRVNAGSGCVGVDLNRNWSYQWGLNNGSSGNPCSETYRGAAPFSEPETATLSQFISAHPFVRYVHDMHSYGQWLLHPWGFTNALPPGHSFYQRLGADMAALILAVHGRTYLYGPTYTTLYPVSGSVTDWAWGAEHAYSTVIELRGPDFIVPPSEIVPNSEEVLPAVLYLANRMIRPLGVRGPEDEATDTPGPVTPRANPPSARPY